MEATEAMFAATLMSLGLLNRLQAGHAFLGRVKLGRLDDQAPPNDLIAWVEKLIAVIFSYIFPFRRTSFVGDLGATEPVLALYESNRDGGNPVISMAIGAGEGRETQLDLAEPFWTNHLVTWCTFTDAFDIRSPSDSASRGRRVRELVLMHTIRVRDIRKPEICNKKTTPSTAQPRGQVKGGSSLDIAVRQTLRILCFLAFKNDNLLIRRYAFDISNELLDLHHSVPTAAFQSNHLFIKCFDEDLKGIRG